MCRGICCEPWASGYALGSKSWYFGLYFDEGLRLMIRVEYDSISNDGGLDDCSGRIKDVTNSKYTSGLDEYATMCSDVNKWKGVKKSGVARQCWLWMSFGSEQNQLKSWEDASYWWVCKCEKELLERVVVDLAEIEAVRCWEAFKVQSRRELGLKISGNWGTWKWFRMAKLVKMLNWGITSKTWLRNLWGWRRCLG